MEYKIEYYPWDKWEAQAKQDAEDLKNGKMPRVMHMPTEILTVEEIIERYGIDQETINKLREATKNQSND